MRRSVLLSMMHAVGRSYVPRPVIDPSHCKTCRKCERACPVKAIAMEGGVLRIDRKKCIRCYCCQETCPFEAITVRIPFAGRIIRF